MRSICIVTFGRAKPRYLPMFEIFLADALRDGGVEPTIVTIFNRDSWKRWLGFFASMPEDTPLLFWESKSAKSFRYILNLFRFARAARENLRQPVILGGYWPTIAADHFEEEFEPFHTLVKGFDISRISRFLLETELRSLPDEVDATGQPDWDRYTLELGFLRNPRAYFGFGGLLSGYQSTFACPNDCTFCYNNSLKSMQVDYAERSLDRLEEDLVRLERIYPMRSIQLKDMNFFYNRARAFQFMELVYRRGLTLGSNVDITVNDMEEEVFRRFRAYGFRSLFFGLESFSERALGRFNKRYPGEKLIRGFELADKYKTFLTGSILIGLPWQTEEDIRKEVSRALHVMNRYDYVQIGVNPVRPVTGTALQKKYFTNTLNGKSLEEYVDIIGFKVWKMQSEIYGERFDFVNMEKLHNTMLAIKSLRKLEVQFPNPFYRRIFPRLRGRLESHARSFSRRSRLLNPMLRETWIMYLSLFMKATGMAMERISRTIVRKGKA